MARRTDGHYGKGEITLDGTEQAAAWQAGSIAKVDGKPTRGVRREVKEFIARATAPVILEAGEPMTQHGDGDNNYLYLGVNGNGLDVDIYVHDPTKPDGKGRYLGRAENLPECNSLSCFNGVKGIRVRPNVLACSAKKQDAARVDPFCEINELDRPEDIARLIEARMYVFEDILTAQNKLEIARTSKHAPLIIESNDQVPDIARMPGMREFQLTDGAVYQPRSFVHYQKSGDNGEKWANSPRIIKVVGHTWVVTKAIIEGAATRRKIRKASGGEVIESNARLVMQGLAGELGGEPLTIAFQDKHVAELGRPGQPAEMLAFHKLALVGGEPSAGLFTPTRQKCTVIEAPVDPENVQIRWILLLDYSRVSTRMTTHNAEEDPLEAPTYATNNGGVLTRVARWLGVAN